MQTADFEALAELNRRCCSVIWNMETESRADCGPLCLHELSPQLIIPQYKKATHRISEQEARFAFVAALSGTSTHYSVETPTACDFTFTSGSLNTRSAETDLTLHLAENGQFRRWVNVEFKAGNPNQASQRASAAGVDRYSRLRKDPIPKDLEKLVREQKGCDTIGNWFHLLDNNNAGTFPRLFEKMRGALGPFAVAHRVDILFCFCVRRKRTAYLRAYAGHTGSQELQDFFSLGEDGIPGVGWQHYSY